MFDASRRTGLFIISYAPLAAMFVALKWPEGWTACDLLQLAAWVLALAIVALALAGFTIVTGPISKWGWRGLSLAGVVVVVYGVVRGWPHPLVFDPPGQKTSALAAAIALWFGVLGLGLVALLLHNAGRGSKVTWTVTDPRDQSGAVAGYLATYLLPLLSLAAGGWRVTAALVIYLVVMYMIYVQSDALLLVNPTLAFFGYRIYDVLVQSADPGKPSWRIVLLTRMRITDTTEVDTVPLGDTINYLGSKPLPAVLSIGTRSRSPETRSSSSGCSASATGSRDIGSFSTRTSSRRCSRSRSALCERPPPSSRLTTPLMSTLAPRSTSSSTRLR